MYAIIETGGKQYRVEEGKPLVCEKLLGDTGATVTFDKVLFVSQDKGDEGRAMQVGAPYLDKAKVTAKILEQTKGEKILIFKYKPKKRYRRKTGHRQQLTKLIVEAISIP